MISSQELAFVRLAMRHRLLSAHVVREALERKECDKPDRPISQILVDMGALNPNEAQALQKRLKARLQRRTANRPKPPSANTPTLPVDPKVESASHKTSSRATKRIGNFEIVKLLGAGAMGAVYHARHVSLERDVALKLLQSEGAPTPRAIARFKREAKLAARLDHPNIVRVYEAGLEEGEHYIAMDMVQGRSLAELLLTPGGISPRRAVHIMRKVCEAVGYAHTQGVIHRDLKPANILIAEPSGNPLVTDFGLAVMAEPDEDDKLTRTGAAVGTPAYMAPEQVRGHLDKIDGRSDVYALGATFFEMLCGTPPFEASTFLELAKQICEVEPPSPRRRNPQVPVDVETICLKALEKDQRARYQTAEDMAADLAAFLDDAEIAAQRPGPITRFRKWARRRPALVAGLLGFVAVLLGYGVYHLTLPGILEISTRPGSAQILLDDKPLGLTPDDDGYLRLEVPAGEHVLRFQKDAFLSQALGVDRVVVGHGESLQLSCSLVSARGILRVDSDPPGAFVQVRTTDGLVVEEGTTNLLAWLDAGSYEVALQRPPDGQRLDADDATAWVEVEAGGRAAHHRFLLKRDQATLTIDAEPPGATILIDGKPAVSNEIPGHGTRSILVTKPGYLPKRLDVDVPSDQVVERRVTLCPLPAYRRPLEGALLAPPHVADVDADGAPDLVLLERGPDQTFLTVRPGGGRGESLFKVPTQATTILGSVDVDADGLLDLVLGSPLSTEVRSGARGILLAQADLDATQLSLWTPDNAPPALVGLNALERVVTINLSLDPNDLPQLARGPRTPPLVLTAPTALGGDLLNHLAVFPQDGEVLVHPLLVHDGLAADHPPLQGVTPQSTLRTIQPSPQTTWLVVLPELGPAHILELNPSGFSSMTRAGDADARYRSASFAHVPDPDEPSWLILSAAEGARAFSLRQHQATPQDDLQLPPNTIALPSSDGPPILWAPTGQAFSLDRGRWQPDPDRTADTEPWAQITAQLTLADLDGDGRLEVLAPTPDRRSLVGLAPYPDRIRWRAAAPAVTDPPPADGSVTDAPTPDLVYADQQRLLAHDGRDGRLLPLARLNGTITHVAAGPISPDGQRTPLFAAIDHTGGSRVVRLTWDGEAWATTWEVERDAHGLVGFPYDVDTDGFQDVLAGGPLAALGGANGAPLWQDPSGLAASDALPVFIGGSIPMGLTARPSPRGSAPAELAAFDPAGRELWHAPLEHDGQPDPARQIVAHPDADVVLAITAHQVVAIGRTDGTVRWRAPAGSVVGGLLHPRGESPRAVVSTTDGQLVALDARTGNVAWRRDLPPHPEQPRPPSAPVAILRPFLEATGPQDALAVVAPSGVLLHFDLQDGQWTGEHHAWDGEYAPWLRAVHDPTVPDSETLLLVRTTRNILEARPGLAGPRFEPTARQEIREQLRLLDMGQARAEQALSALEGLAATQEGLRLTLAQAYLDLARRQEPGSQAWRRGLDAAQANAESALRRRESPKALRLLIEVVFRRDGANGIPRIRDLASRLAESQPNQAARALVEVAEALSPNDEDGREQEIELLKHAVRLSPSSAPPHRELGLRAIDWKVPERIWSEASRPERLDGRRWLALARTHLLLALSAQDDAETRAAALIALTAEQRLTLSLRGPGADEDFRYVEQERYSFLDTLLQMLSRRESPARTPEHARLLQIAIALANTEDRRERARLVDELASLRPEWERTVVRILRA